MLKNKDNVIKDIKLGRRFHVKQIMSVLRETSIKTIDLI